MRQLSIRHNILEKENDFETTQRNSRNENHFEVMNKQEFRFVSMQANNLFWFDRQSFCTNKFHFDDYNENFKHNA